MNNQDPLMASGRASALTGNAAIMDQVSQALRGNATTARYPIDVAALGATVTLTGTVGSQDAKRTAEQVARSVPGVIDVTNELVVGGDDAGDAGGLGVLPVASSSGAHAGNAGGTLGAPLAAGLAGDDGSAGSGAPNQSRNADAEEEDAT